MEKMKGRDVCSQSCANGLLIPANNGDVRKMGGMSEEIDTAGGGEGREEKVRWECLRAPDSS